MTDPTALTLAETAAALRAKRLSSTELVRARLARIERLNPRLGAYVTVTAERALADARRADEEIARGDRRGPLHGVPIGLKDLYDTAGIRTAYGSKVHREHVPAADSTVARKLRDAGAVLLGKENTHEYAWGVTTTNPHWGPTRNPWDPTRIPGGSSGGSAAAVAAGLSCASMGSDTGGSIRVPASLCGVVGLKPTFGRVSKAGVFPMSFRYDHAGPLARTVEDAAIVLDAVQGYDPADPSSVRVAPVAHHDALAHPARGLTVGVPRARLAASARPVPAVERAFEAALDVLRAAGLHVVDVDFPPLVVPEVGEVFVTEAHMIHAATLAARPQDLGIDLQQLFALPGSSGARFVEATAALDAYAAAVHEVLETTAPVVVLPTTRQTAAPIGAEMVRIGDDDVPVLFAFGALTVPFNVAHVPALSLPCGVDDAGLPIGLQIVGRPFDETTVLRVGHTYQQATDWHRRRPPEP